MTMGNSFNGIIICCIDEVLAKSVASRSRERLITSRAMWAGLVLRSLCNYIRSLDLLDWQLALL